MNKASTRSAGALEIQKSSPAGPEPVNGASSRLPGGSEPVNSSPEVIARPLRNRNDAKPIWVGPWSYAEGWFICLALLLTGFSLQLTIGGLDPETLSWPLNAYVGGAFTLVLIWSWYFAGNTELVRWLAKAPAAITSIALVTFLVLLMGFTLQGSSGNPDWVQKLGLNHMTRSWPFLFGMTFFMASLGMATLKRITPFKGRNIGFFLNHAGLYIALLAGILGAADLQRITMDLRPGEVVWVGHDHRGRMHELPVALQLHSFNMDEFNPKLTVIETDGARMVDGAALDMFEITGGARGTVAGVDIEVLDYYPLAMAFAGRYEPVNEYGSAPAALVRATSANGRSVEGWISSGSFMLTHMFLPIDSTYSVAMTIPRSASYSSDVAVYTASGDVFDTRIEVNKPVSAEGWKMYQYSYDERFGRYSQLSVIEFVRDPWLPVVYTGIFMLLLGSVYLMFLGKAPVQRDDESQAIPHSPVPGHITVSGDDCDTTGRTDASEAIPATIELEEEAVL